MEWTHAEAVNEQLQPTGRIHSVKVCGRLFPVAHGKD